MNSKFTAIISFIVFLMMPSSRLSAQFQDSLVSNQSYKAQFILPGSLVLGGTIIHLSKELKKDLQFNLRAWNPSYHTNLDDYLEYVPILSMYIADIFKIESQSSVWDQSKYLFISEALTAVLVQGLKISINETRPDGTDYSFPSGHTAESFVGATVLYHEFKDSQPFLAYSGYVVASLIGYSRIMNNRHWSSDVLTSAGIGILMTNLVYQFKPLKRWNPWTCSKNISTIPYITPNHFGIVLNVKL